VSTAVEPRSGRVVRVLGMLRADPVLAVSSVVVLLTLVAAVLAPVLAPYSPIATAPGEQLQDLGSPGHLLGTDQLGRDVLSRILYGARIAWTVGLTVASMSLVGGIFLGALSFYASGWLDSAVTRLVDGVLAFPPLLLALVLAAVMGPSTRTAIIALSIVFVPLAARVMRSAVLGERELDYVKVSRGMGHRELWTLWRHVLPNTLPPMIVVATIVVSRAIIVESSLSFLGAGTQAPTPSWGLMIGEAREVLLIHPALAVVPALVLSAAVLCINLFADSLGDALDVNTRQLRAGRGGGK
jgi:ABC-type dipeptide/oligopeptide/nickel transport system permease subunit